MVGTLTTESAGYIAGYVVKKMTASTDIRLNGRHPEFARMSLRPGIGADMMDEVASTLMTYGLETQADVPSALRHGNRVLPLGRYLRRRLRERIGKDPSAPQSTMDEIAEEMRPLREAASRDNADPRLKHRVLEKTKGKRIQINAAHNRNRKKERL